MDNLTRGFWESLPVCHAGDKNRRACLCVCEWNSSGGYSSSWGKMWFRHFPTLFNFMRIFNTLPHDYPECTPYSSDIFQKSSVLKSLELLGHCGGLTHYSSGSPQCPVMLSLRAWSRAETALLLFFLPALSAHCPLGPGAVQ